MAVKQYPKDTNAQIQPSVWGSSLGLGVCAESNSVDAIASGKLGVPSKPSQWPSLRVEGKLASSSQRKMLQTINSNAPSKPHAARLATARAMGFSDGYLSCPLVLEMIRRLGLGAWREQAYEDHVRGFIQQQWEPIRRRAEAEIAASDGQRGDDEPRRQDLWASILEWHHAAEGVWEGCRAWQTEHGHGPEQLLGLIDVLALDYDAEAFDIVDAVKGSRACFLGEERCRQEGRDGERFRSRSGAAHYTGAGVAGVDGAQAAG